MAVRGSIGRDRPAGNILLELAAAGWSISFTHCPEVAAGLESILHGWGLSHGATGAPDATIVKTGAGYDWTSATRSKPVLWDERPPKTAMDAISDVHDVLFDWYLADHPDLLCLHAGAVDFGPGLVCLPSIRKAGKSTLSVALASRGFCFYCDDVLPVEPGSLDGIAMGIAPLLRKPLPPALGGELIGFIAKHAGPSSETRTYVCLGAGHTAPFERRKPIQALVLLDRRPTGRAALEPVAKPEMLREVVMQNFGARASPTLVLDSFATLIESRDCFRMIYDDVMDAADLLGERFA